MATLNIAYTPNSTQVNTQLDELGAIEIYQRLTSASVDIASLSYVDIAKYCGSLHTLNSLTRDLKNIHRNRTNPKPKRKSRAGTKPCPVRMLQLAEVA